MSALLCERKSFSYPQIRQMREGRTWATSNGNVPRGSFTLSGAPNWCARRLSARSECTRDANADQRIRPENEAVPECVRRSNVTTIGLNLAGMPGCGRNFCVEWHPPCVDSSGYLDPRQFEFSEHHRHGDGGLGTCGLLVPCKKTVFEAGQLKSPGSGCNSDR